MAVNRSPACYFVGAIALLICGIAFGRLTARSELPLQPTEPKTRPDEFLHRAQQLSADREQGDNNQTRAELLRQVAFFQQQNDPASAPPFWATLRASWIEPLDSETRIEQLSELVNYQESLDDSALSCSSLVGFDTICEIREEVEQEITLARDAIGKELLTKLQPLTVTPESPDISTATDIFQRLKNFAATHEAAILLLMATAPTQKSDPLLGSIFHAEERLSDLVKKVVDSTRRAVDKRREQLIGDNASLIDPQEAKQGKYAICDQWCRDLTELVQVVQTPDSETWSKARNLVRSSPSSSSDEPSQSVRGLAYNGQDSGQPVFELITEIRQLQAMAYNLWALRELEAAETSAEWPERLARLDTSVLDPAVAAIYSTVYSRRIEEIKDPQARSHVVQQLLSNKRTPITSF